MADEQCMYMEGVGEPGEEIRRCPERKGLYVWYCSRHMLTYDSEWTEERHQAFIEQVERTAAVQAAEQDEKVVHLHLWRNRQKNA
ncbi:hypothetical protein [Streptomyces sp. CFMR 7]|uniref:hypothetical protein n=1 Tax=Streptomyces sp. CFMR 7 TaxID=1649184 RepID=UPI0011A81297|nr:hypothetical protein [Streptomyces sp. CFMR 7]